MQEHPIWWCTRIRRRATCTRRLARRRSMQPWPLKAWRSEHLVDYACVTADQLITAREKHGIELIGPCPPSLSWQSHAEGAFSAKKAQENKESAGWYKDVKRREQRAQIRANSGLPTAEIARPAAAARELNRPPKAGCSRSCRRRNTAVDRRGTLAHPQARCRLSPWSAPDRT